MGYSLMILWHERQRYLPAMLAVTFSALLLALQIGLLLGTFSMVSIPIDCTPADIWVGEPEANSVDMGLPIPERWRDRLEEQPEIVQTEPDIQMFLAWIRPHGGTEHAIVVGSRLGDGSLGAVKALTPQLRLRLAEPGAVVVDEADMGRLGLTRGVGEVAQESAYRVKIGDVATIHDDSNDSRVWHGHVTTLSDWFTQRRSVLQEPLQFNDVRTLECLMTLNPDQPPLRIGQRVRVLIGGHQSPDTNDQ